MTPILLPTPAVKAAPVAGILGPDTGKRLVAGLAALFGVLLTGLTCSFLPAPVPNLPLLMGAVGSVSVLLFVVPASPFAQPWAIIGGNTVSALVGVAAARLIPDPVFAAAVAVSGAILVMSLLRCLHPPGGASALAGVMGGATLTAAGWMYPAVLFADCCILVLSGLLIHKVIGNRYPQPALPAPPPVLDPLVLDRAARDAVAAALQLDNVSRPVAHGAAASPQNLALTPAGLGAGAQTMKDSSMQPPAHWRNRIGLSAMIAIIVAASLIALSAATYVSTRSLMAENTAKRGEEMQETNIRVAWHVLNGVGREFRQEGDTLYAGSVALNDNSAVVDKIKSLVGGTATIFRGDMRIATNVTKDDGTTPFWARAWRTEARRRSSANPISPPMIPSRTSVVA
jgi:CBS domain-containing membrane protein